MANGKTEQFATFVYSWFTCRTVLLMTVVYIGKKFTLYFLSHLGSCIGQLDVTFPGFNFLIALFALQARALPTALNL